MVLRSKIRLILVLCILVCAGAVELPCGRRQPGDQCSFDEECEGLHSRCVNRICACPEIDFEDYMVDNRTRVCRPAPRTVNAKCQKNCRPPLVCQDGQCVCWKAKQVGNQCVLECPPGQVQVGQSCQPVSQTVSGQCSNDLDCQAPFTICEKNKCVCLPGLQSTANGCVPKCPDGSTPGAACRLRYLQDRAIRSNIEQMNTCPRGQRCVTYGKPDIGHCCKAYCPYGEPDLTKSCKKSDLLHKPNIACPETSTHYCQSIDNNGATDRICCPRPCRDPTPYYENGKCHPFSHLDDPCGTDEQCEGGVAMTCVNEKCQCRTGFSKQDSGTFPTCVRSDCNPVTSVVVQNQCMPKVLVYGGACVDNAQCPPNMRCSGGQCACKCGSSYALGVCVNPNDPLNVSPFLCGLQSIFQRGKKPDPKCVNMDTSGSAGSGTVGNAPS